MDDNGNAPPQTSAKLADVAEPKRPGQEREPYFNFFLLSTDALCIADPFGCFKQVNPAFTRLTGYSESELLSKPFLDFVHPEDRQRTAEEMELHVAARSSLNFENRYVCKDGSVVRLSWTAHFDETDGVTYASARDITEHKRTEEALRESRRGLQDAQRLAHIGNWHWAVATDTVTWSDELYRINGRDPALPAPGFAEMSTCYTPESWARLNAAVATTLERREPYALELDLVRLDGAIRRTVTQGDVDRDASGKIVALHGTVQDITERKEVEDALQQSEALYRSILNSSPDAVAITDTDSRIRFHSAIAVTMFGFDADTDLSGRLITDFIVPEDRERAFANISRIQHRDLDRPERIPDEYRAVRADGAVFDVEVMGEFIRDAAGRPTGIVFDVRDITAHKRTEDAIHESEARFQLLFDRASDGIALLSLDGELLSVNESFARMHGYSAEELLHRNMMELDTPEHAAGLPDRMRRMLAGEALTFDVEHYHRDGHRFPMEVSASLITSGGNALIQAFHRDITARKQAQEAVRESEARFRAVVETVPAAIRIFDGDQIVFANSANSTLTGYSPEEILAPGWLQRIVHPEELPALRRLEAHRIASEPRELHYESRIIRKDGQVRQIVSDTVPIIFGGHPATLITSSDITERKEAEEARRKLDLQVQDAQRLESLGVLAGGIAHDFNNLLTAVLGNIDLALMDIPPESPARESIEEIAVAARRAADLTAQMLAYSGKGHFFLEPLNFAQLVKEMAPLIHFAIPPESVVEYHLAPNTPFVRADSAQVRQVVMSLVTNASESIGDAGGFIEISTGVLSADRACLSETYFDDDLPEGGYAFLEVTDTGSGMDDATRLRIFEPFFTTKFTGRGLGLAAVLGIVRGHHGAINVASEVGRGATFTVLFPVIETSTPIAPAPTPEPAPAPTPRNPTILVVDDDATVRTITSRVLGHSGYTAMTVSNGKDALALFQQQVPFPDLVLLDMSMPGMDGRATFRELRRLDPTVRVVLMSGFDQADAAEQFQGEDLAGFIQKPFLADDLLAALGNALA